MMLAGELVLVEPPGGGLPYPVSRRRRMTDSIARGAMLLSVLLALLPLALVVFYVARRGAHVISWSYLTRDHFAKIVCAPGGSRCSGGIAPDIVGTFLVVGTATLLAAPLGVLAAIYLSEYGRGRLAGVVRLFTDVMTGVPSIIAGIFVFTVIVLVAHRPIYNALAGACALAVLMLPLIIRACEEMLRLVPDSLREASLALGAPRWRTVLRVVVPSAASGITTSIMLAVARAAGETAPLLFTLFGGQNRIRASLFGRNDAIPFHIFTNTNRPEAAFVDSAWGAALTLIAITLLLTVAARIVAARARSASAR
jgi:phosphate transport system permease protein